MSTGGTRDTAGLEAGTSGSVAGGGAEVHGGLHAGGSSLGGSAGLSGSAATGSTLGGSSAAMGDRSSTSGEYGALGFSGNAGAEGVAEKATNRISGVVDSVKDRAQDLSGRAQEFAGQARERVGEVAGQARERASGALTQAQTFLDDQGVTDRIRQNPLPALGLAFGLGYLIAGRSEHKGLVGRARGELRHAIVGGVTAVVAREAKGYLGNVAGGGLLGQLFGQQGGGSGGSTSTASMHRPPSHREQL
jgi:uncharacterized protein YjbJ (UPF0337 family)